MQNDQRTLLLSQPNVIFINTIWPLLDQVVGLSLTLFIEQSVRIITIADYGICCRN